MLHIDAHNAMLVKLCAGAINDKSSGDIDASLARVMDHDRRMLSVLRHSAYPIYSINHFQSLDLPDISHHGVIVLPELMACTLYNQNGFAHVFDKAVAVKTIMVKYCPVQPGVYETHVVFSLDSGLQGEFSMNVLGRQLSRVRAAERNAIKDPKTSPVNDDNFLRTRQRPLGFDADVDPGI